MEILTERWPVSSSNWACWPSMPFPTPSTFGQAPRKKSSTHHYMRAKLFYCYFLNWKNGAWQRTLPRDQATGCHMMFLEAWDSIQVHIYSSSYGVIVLLEYVAVVPCLSHDETWMKNILAYKVYSEIVRDQLHLYVYICIYIYIHIWITICNLYMYIHICLIQRWIIRIIIVIVQ